MVRDKTNKNDISSSKINKKLLFIISLIVLIVSVLNAFVMITVTGNATAETGTVSFCINHPPTITDIQDQSTIKGSLFNLNINGSDEDGHGLTYSDNTSLFTINETSGLINFTSVVNDIGNHTIKITISETNSSCQINTSTTFILEINNSGPTLAQNIPNQEWEQNVQLTGLNLSEYFTDADNDSLTYTAINGGDVTISISGEIVTFTPNPNFAGETWAVFTANDSISTGDSNNVTLNITGENVAPEITIHSPNETTLTNKLQALLNVSLSEIGKISYDIDQIGNVTLCSLCASGTIILNFTRFGDHNITISSQDAVGNVDKQFLNLSLVLDTDLDGINDTADVDCDNDGIVNDKLCGNHTNLKGINTGDLNLTVGGDGNLHQSFTGKLGINISNGTDPLIQFNFDFDANQTCSLGNLTLSKHTTSANRGSLLVRGPCLASGETKTMFVDKVDSSGAVCVKDAELESINEISSKCNSNDEFLVLCPGSNSSYSCSSLEKQYKVTGLNNSGVKEFRVSGGTSNETTTTVTTIISSGGGGTRKVVETVLKDGYCPPSESCTSWLPSRCSAGELQEKICFNVNRFCLQEEITETRNCDCIPQIQCTTWYPSQCNDQQERLCVDTNRCGKALGVPQIRSCQSESKQALTGFAFTDYVGEHGKEVVFWFTFTISTVLILLALVLYLKKIKQPIKIGSDQVDVGEYLITVEINAGLDYFKKDKIEVSYLYTRKEKRKDDWN